MIIHISPCWGSIYIGGGKMRCEESEIKYFTISSSKIKAKIMNYGCTLLSLWVKKSDGSEVDVVLGYEDIRDYFENAPCFGSSVLPNANRIENARFTLNGKVFELDQNDGSNNLHSGFEPLHKRLWDVRESGDDFVIFSISCKDMDMGFPGNRDFSVEYRIIDNKLRISYTGASDKDTLFNPTNHSYFNLLGHDSGDILNHKLTINADSFTPCDEHAICHGEVQSVGNSPMDYRKATSIGKRINDNYTQLSYGNGYDHNYVLNDTCTNPNEIKNDSSNKIPAATLTSPKEDITLNIYTSAPCIQLYTGNYISSNDIGKGNHPYSPRCGVALETQYAPNSINANSFIKPILKNSKTINSTTLLEFVS